MRTLLAAAALALAACADDPVSYSAPVGITLPAVASKDVVSGSVRVDKNINTESGNPYGAFVNDARSTIGHDPSHVALAGATLELLGTSSGVTALEQVFAGTVVVSFEMNGTSALYYAAQVTNPIGSSISMDPGFDSGSMPAEDRTSFMQGQFKVVLTGTTAPGFDTANASADLIATLAFHAYE